MQKRDLGLAAGLDEALLVTLAILGHRKDARIEVQLGQRFANVAAERAIFGLVELSNFAGSLR